MNQLKAIEEINEEIDNIVAVAASISLSAAGHREAGSHVAGGCLVERELQMFSEKIATAMQSLSALIDWQVAVNAGKRSGALTQAHVASACVGAQTDEIEQFIVSQVRELQIGMMRTAKQCASGLLIARSVDQDTERSGAMPPELRSMTEDVAEAVGNIARRLKKLELRLAEAALWNQHSYPDYTGEYRITGDTAMMSVNS